MKDYFKRVSAQTPTRFWINNVTGKQADMALEAGAVGCTQNPAYTWKILNGSEDQAFADSLIREIKKTEKDPSEVLVKLQRELIANVAKHFMPLYEASNHKQGYVSIQGDPLREDAESIIRFARFNTSAAPNMMAKVPVTEEGLKAIRVLVRERIPINATECMAVKQVLDVCKVYMEESAKIDNPAPLYFSLITGIFDQYLKEQVKREEIDISQDSLWQAGMLVAKKVYQIVKERRYNCGFIGGGARGLHHFTEMVGADANITINWIGTADKLLELDQPVVSRFLQSVPYSVEDELVEKLDTFRKAYFINAIKPEEYEDFGPVVLFRNGFTEAWKNAVSYIENLK